MNKLGTKAQNLEVLAREKINAYVLDTYVINYAVWKKNEEGCLENIRRRFSGNVIVRSCANSGRHLHNRLLPFKKMVL